MAGEVLVDALPYIDQGYDDPGVREAVSMRPYYFHLLEPTISPQLEIFQLGNPPF